VSVVASAHIQENDEVRRKFPHLVVFLQQNYPARNQGNRIGVSYPMLNLTLLSPQAEATQKVCDPAANFQVNCALNSS
jgi:hypothetical protein